MGKEFFSKSSDLKQTISGKKKDLYKGSALGFCSWQDGFLVPAGDISFCSIFLPLLQLTPLLGFTGIYPVDSLCNTAQKHFLQKVAEGMAAVIHIFEDSFQSFTTTDIPVVIMMDKNI